MQQPTAEQEVQYQERLLDRQQAGDPNSVYADTMREEKLKNIIQQLNPELLLTEVEHRIRGEKKDPMTGDWIPIGNNGCLISEELVQNYVAFLNVYLTQNNSLSNFSPQEINNIMSVVIDYVKDDLSDNSDLYGLTKKRTITVKRIVKVLKPVTRNGITTMTEHPIEVEDELPVGEEITDYNQFNKIGHIVCHSTFAVLKQAQNGNLVSKIFKALRVNETIGGGTQKSKLDFMKFW